MSYSNPTTICYRFPAVSVASTAAERGRFIGPKGMQGRIIDIGYVVTTGVTVAASGIEVGTAADPNAYGQFAVPIAAAGLADSGLTAGVTNPLPADTVALVGSSGGATAGAVDALVTVEWY